MENGLIITIISAASGVGGVLIAWLTLSRKGKKDTEHVGETRGVMASDIGYIKAGVDDLKNEGRETRKEVRELAERVTRCEESVKQAHKRVDETHTRMTEYHHQ
jgi:peptidoglycan hydrolase CwlO-like protein